jgi:uncharacterized membrane protein
MNALSRGETALKINTVPQAVVLSVGLIAAAGLVVGLAFAGWSAEAIVGFGGLALALVTGQFVAARRASVVEAKTDQQTATLDTIRRQTNGLSAAERNDIAVRAARAALDERDIRGGRQ